MITFPKLKWPWDEAQLKSLQKWIDQVRDAFQGRISYVDNMNSELVQIEFTAGTTPSKRVASQARPLGVLLLGVQQIQPASNTPPVASDAFSWTYNDGSISLPSLATIAGTARYRATVLVIQG